MVSYLDLHLDLHLLVAGSIKSFREQSHLFLTKRSTYCSSANNPGWRTMLLKQCDFPELN